MMRPSLALAIDMSVGLPWKLRSKKACDSRRLSSLWRNASWTRASSAALAAEDVFLRVGTIEHAGASTGIGEKRQCATADLPFALFSTFTVGTGLTERATSAKQRVPKRRAHGTAEEPGTASCRRAVYRWMR